LSCKNHKSACETGQIGIPIDTVIGIPIISDMDSIGAIRKLVDLLGGQETAARALGVKQPTVSGWINGKHGMSAIVAMRAERATGGVVAAGDLCPELNDLTPAA
jgi:DNA-binding transcriptional regulator YdaS (Cro superfamily)